MLLVGDRVILPSTALAALDAFIKPGEPVTLEIASGRLKTSKTVAASVLEFTAEEDSIVLPVWMRQHLGLSPGTRSGEPLPPQSQSSKSAAALSALSSIPGVDADVCIAILRDCVVLCFLFLCFCCWKKGKTLLA